MMKYAKNVTRSCSLFDVRAWYEGESKELEKWLTFGFYDTFFVSKNGMVTVYYSESELKKFDEILDEKLDEKFFDDLCDDFFKIIEISKNEKENKDIFKISVQCWPALTIFDVISKYPEFATKEMMRRLTRIRQSTEAFHYTLSNWANHTDLPKDYIFFKNNVILKSFEKFINDERIIIEGETN